MGHSIYALLIAALVSGCGTGVTNPPTTPPHCTYLSQQEDRSAYIYRCDAGFGKFSIAYLRSDGSISKWCADKGEDFCR